MARRPNFLRNSVPALPLLAKNSSLNCFLNARTQGFKSDFNHKLKTKTRPFGLVSIFGGGNRIWTDESGFCRPTPYHLAMPPYQLFDKNRTQETGRILCPVFYGADDEARTRYLHLGKVALYQMSYIRIQLVPPIGIEPMTRGFSVLCSTNWATEAKNGDPERARTVDL